MLFPSVLQTLTLLFVVWQNEPSKLNAAEIAKASSDSVVLINTFDAFGRQLAQGSGFIVSADGKIATNHHVLKDASTVAVKLNSGASFSSAEVIADDSDRDLALLKVEGRNLPALGLQSTNATVVGERVVAIGSPLGLENTVSDGLLSGFREDANGRRWIQTTAAVSHGNSGGPLIGENGKVIGVITLGVMEGAQNLNFAVPADAVQSLIDAPRRASVVLPATKSISLTKDSVWTSLTSGRDFKLRFDGDYLYTDWVNEPEQLRNAGGFVRSELRKTGDGTYVGKVSQFLPCMYYTQVRWCRTEGSIEIRRLSLTRIEGVSESWGKFNCRKCQPEKVGKKEFTWIPKD